MKKSTPLLLFLILIIACGQNTETKKHSKGTSVLMDSLTHQIRLANKEGKIVGFSVAIFDTTGILYNEGFGFSDSATEKAYSTETIQYVASVSKTLIGISLFKAQELGKLNIDEPINNYLPFKVVNSNFPEIPITIRQLATHTSSITDSDAFWESNYLLLDKDQPKNTGVPGYFNQPKTRMPISELLKELLTQDGLLNNGKSFSTNEPNKKFDYSNVGSTLCAFVIESAMGMSYRIFTKEYILKPLKMSASGWSVEDVNADNRSTLYVTNKEWQTTLQSDFHQAD